MSISPFDMNNLLLQRMPELRQADTGFAPVWAGGSAQALQAEPRRAAEADVGPPDQGRDRGDATLRRCRLHLRVQIRWRTRADPRVDGGGGGRVEA